MEDTKRVDEIQYIETPARDSCWGSAPEESIIQNLEAINENLIILIKLFNLLKR